MFPRCPVITHSHEKVRREPRVKLCADQTPQQYYNIFASLL